MQILPIDVTALVAVIMGVSIILVPVIGLTARFALKPTVEALGRFFERRGVDESVDMLERRMALMEQQIESLDNSVRQLADVADFHRALSAGTAEPTGESEPTSESEENDRA